MLDGARVELYRREDGLFGWRLKTANGEIVATDGGQGYEHKGFAMAMAARVLVPGIPIVSGDGPDPVAGRTGEE